MAGQAREGECDLARLGAGSKHAQLSVTSLPSPASCHAWHMQNMVRWGNKAANEYWEATVPDEYYIPDENDNATTVGELS